MASHFARPVNGNGAATTREEAQVQRVGFGIMLAGLAVMFVLLVGARYLFVGSQVGGISQFVGALVTAIVLAAVWLVSRARTAAWNQDLRSAASGLGWAAVLAVASALAVLVQWIGLGGEPLTNYNQIFYAATGIWMLYPLASAFALFGARRRIVRFGDAVAHGWNVEANSLFWTFTALAWVVLWIVFYFA
jgi:cytochrome c oxidase subunit 3